MSGTDPYQEAYMAGAGAGVARDKFVSRSMVAILGVVALALILGGAAFAMASMWSVAAIWLPLSLIYCLLAIGFAVVRTTVTSSEVHVQYGLWGPRVPLAAITRCEAIDYDWKRYGGYGIRLGHEGTWAYVPTGAKRVVLLHWLDGDKEKRAVFAAQDADGLAAVIQRARSAGGARIETVAESDDAALAELAAEEAAEEEALQPGSGLRAPGSGKS